VTNLPDDFLESLSQADAEKAALIAELQQAKIRHSPDKIIRITKLPNGKIVFLETGNLRSGLQHILTNHTPEFADRGISEDQIPDAVMTAVINGSIMGYQGVDRPIYEVTFNGRTQLIAVTVGSNGYIVGANPGSV
jgi:hypothetical protein